MMEDSHDRFIVVPTREVEFPCYVEAVAHPDNFEVFELHESEFWSIYDTGFLRAVNKRYHLMLDDFEGGKISENLDFVLSEAERVKDVCPTLYKAAEAAVRYGTLIDFEF